ncbi:MAG: hypothetical protein AAFX76_05495 [Planctomycetota bacterium]
MKTKDFGFFQQHTEKIVLGLGVAVLVGIGLTQFVLGEPNAVDLGNQKNVAPDEIKDTVVGEAQRLRGRLDRPRPDVEAIAVPRYARSFRDLYRLDIASDQAIAPLASTGLAPELNRVISPDYPERFLPTPPIANDLLAKAEHGVLADDGTDRFFRLQEIVGNTQPADFPYVSVSGKFPLAELKARYEATDRPAENRLEEGLWIERLVATSVRLLRQKQDPVTGEWGEATMIAPLPGQIALPEEGDPSLTFEQTQQLQDFVRQNQEGIRRPEFPSISNGPWTPPDINNRQFTPEELRRIDEINDQIRRLERRIAQSTGRDERSERRPNRGDRGLRDNSRGAFDPRGLDDGGGIDRGPSDADNRRQDRAARRVDEWRAEIAELQQELNEIRGVDEPIEQPGTFRAPDGLDGFDGFDPTQFGGGSFPGAPGNIPIRRNPGVGVSADDVPETITVWAHDLTAEPGQTYRYKIVVGVLNPLYRFSRLNPEQLEANQDRLTLLPDPAELESAVWSAPITLDPEFYFFLTGGSRDQNRANFEVWTVHDGLWRSSEFTEYPGDPIGGMAEVNGVPGPVPMRVGPILLDVDTVTPPSGRGSSVRALFLDPASGRIDSRLVVLDKDSPDLLELRLKADEQLRNSQLSERGGN